MRNLFLCVILLFFSGCIDYQLSGNEKIACAHFTDATITGIPTCEKNTSCQEKMEGDVGNPSFHVLPVGTEWEKTKNHVVKTWLSLNDTQELLKKTNAACTKGNVLEIWALGIQSAGAIQKGLKSSEQANANTLLALKKSAETAEKWELVYVKDTEAFQAYAELLEIIQGITTNDWQNETASIFSQNQSYFEGLTESLTQNQANGTNVDWKSAFDLYKTSVLITSPEKGKNVIWFSPVWQGLISAFTSQKKAMEILDVLQYVQAPQMVEMISQTVRPQNGFVSKVMNALIKLETGIEKLNEEEKENEKIIQEKIESVTHQLADLESKITEMIEWDAKMDAWSNVTGIPILENKPNSEKWKNELNMIESQWSEIQEGKENGTISIGKRVESQRSILRALESIQVGMDEEEKGLQKQNEMCMEILESVQQSVSTDSENESTYNCSEIMGILANAPVSNISEEYEKAILNSCVNELNAWNKGVGVAQTYTAESFLQEFGEAALSACESAKLHAQQEYENQFSIQEIKENAEKLEEWIVALTELPNGSEIASEIDEMLDQLDQPIPSDEQEDILEALEEYVSTVEKILGEEWVKQSGKETWKIESNGEIYSNVPITATWKMKLENPYHTELAFPFTLAWESPIEWNQIQATSGIVNFEDEKVVLEGDHIPSEGIIIEGEGSTVVVAEQKKISVTKLVGNTAMVNEIITLDTKYAPVLLSWKWVKPMGVDSDHVQIMMNNQPIQEQWDSDEAKAIVSLTQPLTEIALEYLWKNVVVSYTTLTETHSELGKTVHSYQTSVENTTSLVLSPSIDTGISADPFETEWVVVTDESGNVVSFTSNALMSVVIQNVSLQANETRTFFITVARPEGMETWKALIQTLLDQVKPWTTFPNTEIAAKANQLYHKIQALLQTNDIGKIAAALPGLTNEVEALGAEVLAAEEEMAENNVEWNEIKENLENNAEWNESEQVANWISNGNEAQKKNQQNLLQKITQNASDWMQNQIPKSEIEQKEGANDEFIQKIDETIVLAQKIGIDIVTYEKNQSLACGKLFEVGYVCPISEEQQKKIKSGTKEKIKELEKMKTKWKKKNIENDEVKMDEKTLDEIMNQLEIIENQVEKGIIALEKMAEKVLSELRSVASENKSDEVQSAKEKAESAFENKEFGKTIYIAQNIVSYIKGKNPLTGLSSIPAEGIPLVGIALLGMGWYGYRKWKEKNAVAPIVQTIPRKDETITRPREPIESDE